MSSFGLVVRLDHLRMDNPSGLGIAEIRDFYLNETGLPGRQAGRKRENRIEKMGIESDGVTCSQAPS
jgi:hypothetical protein